MVGSHPHPHLARPTRCFCPAPPLAPALPGIAFNITAATSMQAVACPSGGDSCSVSYWIFAVAFGGAQLFVSQLPNLDSLWQISALGTLMSFGCESAGCTGVAAVGAGGRRIGQCMRSGR